MQVNSLHTFHIPVMGLAFTIDTPIKVARYGIDSVMSIIEDKLIELMRRHYCGQTGRKYVPITTKVDDYRARRITDYLNLVNDIVKEQVDKLRNSFFEAGSEITKYFEMLPTNSPLQRAYERMKVTASELERERLIDFLRAHVQPGRIDVNIMTKVDKNNYDKEGNVLPESSDALAALRGYANSALTNSAVIFSAGLNPRLFNYLEKLTAFDAIGHGRFEKEVVIKVSDYRSALIQGKYLAKKGVWVSEFRIESGLNCGGHAFATDGSLLGPILEEFKLRRVELVEELHRLYLPAARAKGVPTFADPHPVRITVQGGIGTAEEANFLRTRYNVHSTGWGTPFLLCPEATTVDEPTLRLLSTAEEKDLILSKASPLGVRFNYLKGTTAERERLERIVKGKPGSPCTEKHLVSNTEFSEEPICTASHAYQKRKIDQLQSLNLPVTEYTRKFNDVVSKECLCVGLSNSAILTYDLPPIKNLEAVTICPGPNLPYFNKVATLREMIDHIYGRANVIVRTDRPHMFIKELLLNVAYLDEQVVDLDDVDEKAIKDLLGFAKNLLKGVEYYRALLPHLSGDVDLFRAQLASAELNVNELMTKIQTTASYPFPEAREP